MVLCGPLEIRIPPTRAPHKKPLNLLDTQPRAVLEVPSRPVPEVLKVGFS